MSRDDDHGQMAEYAQRVAQMLAGALSAAGAEDLGFMLLLFEFERAGQRTYVSNANRSDMLRELQAMVAHLRSAGTAEGDAGEGGEAGDGDPKEGSSDADPRPRGLDLPPHIILSIEHNPHLEYYQTIERYRTERVEPLDENEWDGDSIRSSGELWEVRWYPDSPNGFYLVCAGTLERALELARLQARQAAEE